MTRKFLESLGLDSSQELYKGIIGKILDENSADIGKAKADLAQVKSERDEFQKKLEDAEIRIESLAKASVESENLKRQIFELTAENQAVLEARSKEVSALKIENAIDRALTGAGAKNLRAVKALIDHEGLSLNDSGNVDGLSEQIERLVSSDDTGFLFAAKSEHPFVGVKPADKSDVKPDISSMTYSQYLAMTNEI